jgi:hypothetical protein
LTSGDDRRHRHYLDIERPRFIRACRRDDSREFEILWAELDALTPVPEPDTPIPFARSILPFRLNYQSRTTRDATESA